MFVINIRNKNCIKKNSRLIKILSVILIGLILISSCSSVFATTNSWGLETSQVDLSYFYSNGGHANSQWSVTRQNAWLSAFSLGKTFNMYVVNTSLNVNPIYQMNVIYDKGYVEATALARKWNAMNAAIQNLMTDTHQLCGSSVQPPTVNNKKVTTAEYQNLYSQIQSKQIELTDLVQEISDLYLIASYDSSGVSDKFYFSMVDVFDTLWNSLSLLIQSIGTGSTISNNLFGISWTATDMENIANSVSAVTKTFAYAIAVVLFGINVINTSLQYELLTLRGGIRVFGRILLVKIWIDIAIPICIYTLNIINSLTQQILRKFTIYRVAIITRGDMIDSGLENHSWIDTILNFFAEMYTALPFAILAIVLIVCVCSVIVKIIARAFELTCLISLSPLFFATLVGDETKRYFSKFISSFLSTAAYIVFISIVYAVATQWIDECTSVSLSSGITALAGTLIGIIPRCLIVIACCNLMRKPPKVLTSLFEGG